MKVYRTLALSLAVAGMVGSVAMAQEVQGGETLPLLGAPLATNFIPLILPAVIGTSLLVLSENGGGTAPSTTE